MTSLLVNPDWSLFKNIFSRVLKIKVNNKKQKQRIMLFFLSLHDFFPRSTVSDNKI